MPLRRLKEMEAILENLIAINKSTRLKRYKKMRWFRIPKKDVKVGYDFYLN